MHEWWERWRDEIAAAAAGAVVALSLAVVASIVLSLARQWVFVGTAWPSLPWGLWGPHETVAWQVALLGGVGLAWALRRDVATRLPFRAAAAIGALGLAILCIFSLRPAPTADAGVPWDLALGLAAGAATLAWIARERARRPAPRHPAARVALAAALGLAVVGPSIAESIDDHRAQSFPQFRVDFVAAQPVTEATPGAVFVDGQWVRLNDPDYLAIADDDVRRIRWTTEPGTERPGILIRFDPKSADAVRRRSIARQSQLDVIVVGGRRFMVVQHDGLLLTGELALFVPPDRGEDLAWLYQQLTGLSAPSATH